MSIANQTLSSLDPLWDQFETLWRVEAALSDDKDKLIESSIHLFSTSSLKTFRFPKHTMEERSVIANYFISKYNASTLFSISHIAPTVVIDLLVSTNDIDYTLERLFAESVPVVSKTKAQLLEFSLNKKSFNYSQSFFALPLHF